MSRKDWDKRNYPVFVGTHYRKEWAHASTPGLADDPKYERAKHEGDVNAALSIVKNSLSRLYLLRMRMMLDDMEAKGFQKPILVAPYRADSKNMLARTAAVYLGEQLGLKVDENIVEQAGKSRKLMKKLERIFNTPRYSGEVKRGQAYIAVDDMITTGGTLSELRSYIDENGGRYLYACVLASNDGKNKKLDPKPEQIEEVYKNLGDRLATWLENSIGIKIPTLTEAEAAFLGTKAGYLEIRDAALAPR